MPSAASTITGDTSGNGVEGIAITGDLSATDPQGLNDSTYFTVSTDPNNGTASIDAESGAWTYTPIANFTGSDSFIVTVTDDLGGITTQTIDLNITPVIDDYPFIMDAQMSDIPEDGILDKILIFRNNALNLSLIHI